LFFIIFVLLKDVFDDFSFPERENANELKKALNAFIVNGKALP